MPCGPGKEGCGLGFKCPIEIQQEERVTLIPSDFKGLVAILYRACSEALGEKHVFKSRTKPWCEPASGPLQLTLNREIQLSASDFAHGKHPPPTSLNAGPRQVVLSAGKQSWVTECELGGAGHWASTCPDTDPCPLCPRGTVSAGLWVHG